MFDSGDGSVVGGVAKVVKVRAGVGVNQSTLEETETPDWLREVCSFQSLFFLFFCGNSR